MKKLALTALAVAMSVSTLSFAADSGTSTKETIIPQLEILKNVYVRADLASDDIVQMTKVSGNYEAVVPFAVGIQGAGGPNNHQMPYKVWIQSGTLELVNGTLATETIPMELFYNGSPLTPGIGGEVFDSTTQSFAEVYYNPGPTVFPNDIKFFASGSNMTNAYPGTYSGSVTLQVAAQ